ncbi:uncharacterized protein [Clytia hemisphaerica]|uniref:Uncharacterized protein n=1 Tax=Clytia hemisphaerica TaxID=252671 RepID=A0A7M5UQZ5_9CNID|eukprot:TCONS_00021618-protein
MQDNEDQILQAWYTKRRRTTVIGILQKCIFAFEYSSVAVSALYYYQNTFQVQNARLFYSITMAIMYFSAAFSATFVGRYMDKTRNLRRITMMSALLSISGNIIYILPFSRYFPILARGLCGMADGIQPAMSGEFSRVYTKDELGKVLSIYHISASLVYAIAPSTPALFTDVQFHIGPIEINQYNCVGLVLSIVLLLYAILAFINVTDLTKESGYQIFIKRFKQENSTTKGDGHSGERLWSLMDTVTNINLLSIILPDGFLGFVYSLMEVIINMVGLYNFSWSITRVSTLTCIGAIIFSTVMFLFQQRTLKGRYIFYFLFISCFSLAAMELSLLNISIQIPINSQALKMALFESCLGLNIIFGFGSTVYSKWLLFSLVPVNSKSYVESHRYIVAKVCCCTGFFTASFIYQQSFEWFTVLILCCFIIAFILLLRKNRFLRKIKD